MLYPTELRARARIIATYGRPSNFRMAGLPENVPAGRRHPALFDLVHPGFCVAFSDQAQGLLVRSQAELHFPVMICRSSSQLHAAALIGSPTPGAAFIGIDSMPHGMEIANLSPVGWFWRAAHDLL
jgi:hypothetical protein